MVTAWWHNLCPSRVPCCFKVNMKCASVEEYLDFVKDFDKGLRFLHVDHFLMKRNNVVYITS